LDADHPKSGVLIPCRSTSFGPLSFPLEGYTLALDLPVSDDVFPILDEID